MKITLKAARVNKGYTQKEAAEILGISRESLANYEKGNTFPNAEKLGRIETLYDISYDDIIFLKREVQLN